MRRAGYGKQAIQSFSAKLTERFGKDWRIYRLQHGVRTAYIFLKRRFYMRGVHRVINRPFIYPGQQDDFMK